LTWQGLNSNIGYFDCFTLILVRVQNRVCLSHGVQVSSVAWWTATRNVAELGGLVQTIEDGRTGLVLGGRMIERLGDAVCGLHRARVDKEHEFLS
jgi:hypothetical protein